MRPTFLTLLPRVFAPALLTFACGSSPDASVPALSGGQFSETIAWGWGRPELFLLVVDSSAASRELLAAFVDSWQPADARESQVSCVSTVPDPASSALIDRRVVVVRPGGADPVVTLEDDPALHWQSRNRRAPGEASRFFDAVRRALEPPAGEPGSSSVLSALSQVSALAHDPALASTDAERELARALASVDASQVIPFLLSATEDTSPGEPTDYASFDANGWIPITAIVPSSTPPKGGYCELNLAAATPRFQSWLAGARLVNDALGWPCSGDLMPSLSVDCASRCESRSPALDESGQVACRLLVTLNSGESCPKELGWREFGTRDGNRTCEIPQLEGVELESCRSDLNCTGCGPGFCWTEVPELLALDSCAPAHPVPLGLRVVGGADARPQLRATLVCATAP